MRKHSGDKQQRRGKKAPTVKASTVKGAISKKASTVKGAIRKKARLGRKPDVRHVVVNSIAATVASTVKVLAAPVGRLTLKGFDAVMQREPDAAGNAAKAAYFAGLCEGATETVVRCAGGATVKSFDLTVQAVGMAGVAVVGLASNVFRARPKAILPQSAPECGSA